MLHENEQWNDTNKHQPAVAVKTSTLAAGRICFELQKSGPCTFYDGSILQVHLKFSFRLEAALEILFILERDREQLQKRPFL